MHPLTKELQAALKDCKSVLDVGCGSNSPIKYLSKKFHASGIDAYKPNLEESEKQGIHDEYHQMNILDIDKKFKENSFDCVIALDVIEHLTKKDGWKLLDSMEKAAKKKTIVFTPNGYLPQAADDNPWQEHKSGWTVNEMRKRGYHIIGINGWKPLRGECARIRFWPRKIWNIISHITQLYTRNKPELAFQILCIKNKN